MKNRVLKLLTRITTILLVAVMLSSTVGAQPPKGNRVIVIGSINPSLGYDQIANGTATFLVERKPKIPENRWYHDITRFEWRSFPVEALSDTPGAYYDNSKGKYYYDTIAVEPYNLTVPDPIGTVTVFSNVVFKGTNENPILKTVFHPDGTSQSILHVKGQTSDDPLPRDLTVTIYNSEYPGGYQIDSTVVRFSFDKSYDVTSIIAQRDVNTVSIVLGTCVGKWDVQSYFWVSTVGTDVYIIMIPDVASWWVSDMEAVRRGVEASCMVKPLVHLDTWKGLTYLEVRDMSTYQYVIEHPDYVRPPGFYSETGIIVVNAHGEVFPIPPGISCDSWLDTISMSTQAKGLTWVQVAGYPFFYYSSGSNTKTQINEYGLRRFLQPILGPNSIDCWTNQEGYAVSRMGGYENRLWGYGLIGGGLHEGRPLKLSSSTNLADLLDVMGYWSNDVLYLTLGLIGFASPNQNTNITCDQRIGYYVHNGASSSDADYNKGKYSMAVASWVKNSLLASGSSDIYYSYVGTWWMGTLKCQIAWSHAQPPAHSGDPWTVRFVTITTAFQRYTPAPGNAFLTHANSPLKVTTPSQGVTFEFIATKSTKLVDSSETSWQNTVRSDVLSTAISIVLIPFTGGWSIAEKALLVIALKFATQILKLPFQSQQPVTSGPYIDLAMEDISDTTINVDNNSYRQLEAIGAVDAYLPQLQGRASGTLVFTLGQRCDYLMASGDGYSCEKMLTLQPSVNIEPRMSADSNEAPQTPQTPEGSSLGHRNTPYFYSTNASDLEGDDVRYIFSWGDGSPNTTTEWCESDSVIITSHQWSQSGTYYVQVQAQDSQGAYSALSAILSVTINDPPSTPYMPSGRTSGYIYETYSYSTNTTDPEGQNVQYEFNWGDGITNMTSWSASGANTFASHAWRRPGSYGICVRARDAYGWSESWSLPLTVNIAQNDAGSGGDAGNDFNSATYISWGTPTYWGTLYTSNPTDTDDYYKYYVYSGQSMYLSMTPPPGTDFELELYNPANVLKRFSYNGTGATEAISYTADSSGYWRARIFVWYGEGQYSFFWGSAPPGGEGQPCPTLFSWNGAAYVDEGIMNIHNPMGEDVVHEALIKVEDVNVANYRASFRLREGWPGLNFSESVIDQVKLYAVDSYGNRYLCPLINATHSRLGNVWFQLLLSDNWKAQTNLLETIDLTFFVPYSNIQGYIFVVEGCNMYKQ